MKSRWLNYPAIDTEPVCQTGGKPSTWFPPGGLVEQSTDKKQKAERLTNAELMTRRAESVC